MRNWKVLTYALVLLAFFIQGWFVYSNYRYEREPVLLDADATAGLNHWREHNCQSCHQVHGFGGFLGPDLTNVVQRQSEEYLHRILQNGMAQMPAFKLPEQTRLELIALFKAFDATGTGYPTTSEISDPRRFFTRTTSIAKSTGRDELIAGLDLMEQNACFGCHTPFKDHIGPDIMTVTLRRDRSYIESNLKVGRGQMPPFGHLTEDQRNLIVETVYFLNENRKQIGSPGQPKVAYLKELPWFEY